MRACSKYYLKIKGKNNLRLIMSYKKAADLPTKYGFCLIKTIKILSNNQR